MWATNGTESWNGSTPTDCDPSEPLEPSFELAFQHPLAVSDDQFLRAVVAVSPSVGVVGMTEVLRVDRHPADAAARRWGRRGIQ